MVFFVFHNTFPAVFWLNSILRFKLTLVCAGCKESFLDWSWIPDSSFKYDILKVAGLGQTCSNMHFLEVYGCKFRDFSRFSRLWHLTSSLWPWLAILWTLLRPRYWYQCGKFVPVDYPWGVDMHEHEILALLPLDLEPWPWPCDSCGHSCVHSIDANMANMCLWNAHEG